ncbi:MAG: ABC transporter ATP-binding protein, partial [Patescibacteria group bacterium]
MKFKDLMKLLWKYLKPKRKLVYWCIFLATFAAAISAIIPLVYGRLVDEAVSSDPNLQIIGIVLLGWLIFVSLSNWMSRFVDFKGSHFALSVYSDFVSDTYNHYLQLPIKFHKDSKTGEELTKIQKAGSSLWEMVGGVVFYLLPSFLTAIIAIALMFATEWRMSVVVVVLLILYTIMTIKKTKLIAINTRKTNKRWEKVWGHVYDTAGNINVVKSHLKEGSEKTTLDKNLDKVSGKLDVVFKLWRGLACWQDNIQGFGFVIVFGLAIYLLILGQISAGILVTFVGYINLVFRPFNQLAQNYRRIQEALVTVDRAVKLYDIETELYNKGKILKDLKGGIEFRNITFSYDKKHSKVLKGINFSVEPGQVIALVGESGTGKTTLLSLISRYYHPDRGRILLDQEDINHLDLAFLRQQIAVVPQEISLFNDTLRKNLAYARKNVNDTEITNALRAANAWEFVNKFPKKLYQKVGERGIKLSTGQKQRIAIARAILRDPKILILDEATSALDSVSEKLVQEALKRLISGRTTFI